MKVHSIKAFEVLDSRGNPTIAVESFVGEGRGFVKVPSGASRGKREAIELRDGGKRYNGMGVLRAVENVNEIISQKIVGKEITEKDYRKIDALLCEIDGTENKSRLGANAILGVSLSIICALADNEKVPLYRFIKKITSEQLNGNGEDFHLPVPMVNVINGGAHAGWNIDFQEYMLVPSGFKTFSDSIMAASEVFHTIKRMLSEKKIPTSVGDEGGFAPTFKSNEEPLELLSKAVEKIGYKCGKDIFFALDCAASGLWDDTKKEYILKKDNKKLTTEKMIDFLEKLVKVYPIVSIEDGLSEDDWMGWKELTKKLNIQIVGDDIFVTNPKIFERGIKESIANAILIKVNQIGTFSETLDVIKMAKENRYKTIISHRSGETEDTFIADLSVGCGAKQIKTGSVSRSERVAKYNRLLYIEQELGTQAKFG